MSRCFPYPPPGYVRDVIRDIGQVESIKREVKKAKKERKKEKRRENKERKAKDNGDVDNKKHCHKRRHKDDGSLADQKDGDRHKKRKLDSKHAEKSNLTEEHGKPIDSQNSSASTSNSNQRQMPVSLPEGGQNSASIIRIRLPLQRHRDPEVVPSLEQSCSAPVRTDLFSRQEHGLAPVSGCVSEEPPCPSLVCTSQELAAKHGKTEQHLSSGAIQTSTSGNELLTAPRIEQHQPSSSEMQYINLIENWAPPLYRMLSADLDNQKWLFEGSQKLLPCTDRCKVENDGWVNLSSTAWPLGHLLLEPGIYALRCHIEGGSLIVFDSCRSL